MGEDRGVDGAYVGYWRVGGFGGFGVGAEVVDCCYGEGVKGGGSGFGDEVAGGGAVEDCIWRGKGGAGGVILGLGKVEAAEVVDAFDIYEGWGGEGGLRHCGESMVDWGL